MKHSKSLASVAPASIVKDRCKDDVPQRQCAEVAQVPAADVVKRLGSPKIRAGTRA
jgi:hypothetical protein